MQLSLNQIGNYIYKKYGGQFRRVLIWDKSPLSHFYLEGTMRINRRTAQNISGVLVWSHFVANDIQFKCLNPNK